MTTQHRRYFYLLLALPLLIACRNASATDPNSGSVGPLSWRVSNLTPPYAGSEAIQRAKTYLGASDTVAIKTGSFVQVSDSTPYGNVRKTVFYDWLLTASEVPVAKLDGTAASKVNLTLLLNAGDKGLDAVFTDKNPAIWVARDTSISEATEPDLFRTMMADGWRIDKPAPQLNSTVSQVLSAFWQTTNIDPANTGQLFLRPRTLVLTASLRQATGKSLPLRHGATYWTVLVSGTKTLDVAAPTPASGAEPQKSTGSSTVMTSLFALFDDIGALWVRSFYLP